MSSDTPEPPRERRPPARQLAKARKGPLDRLRTPYDPLTSIVLTMPVFVVYHLGILFTDLRNGADLVTGWMLVLLERSLVGYVALTLGIATTLVVVAQRLRSAHELRLRAWLAVVNESSVWALLLSFTIGWLTAQLVGAAWTTHAAFALQLGPRALGPLERIVMSAGAGFHEELVFRVGLFGGGAALLERFGWSRTASSLASAFVSSVLFSAVHYVGALGDTPSLTSFVFRALMGLAFAGLYRFRGFAIAVYTHAIYDLLVFFVIGGG